MGWVLGDRILGMGQLSGQAGCSPLLTDVAYTCGAGGTGWPQGGG